MSSYKLACCFLLFSCVGGCSVAQTRVDNLVTSYALRGTNTAVVGIAIDQKGYPLETVKEIVLTPGQKVVFAGPDEFSVVFKDKKTPTRKIKYVASNGVIRIEVPKDILEKPEFSEELKRNNYLKFNYSIFVNGKELDPPLIVKKNH